jgi:hypothetical protein
MAQIAVDERAGRELRRGDVVRVRSREEIMATLDDEGGLGGLPFMPEMLAHCGREVPVYARADKTCDTIDMTGATLRMQNTVHLVGLRCDGSAHGGCQAGCLFFWREDWLARPDGTEAPPPEPASPADVEPLNRGTTTLDGNGETIYRCQATELPRASTSLSPYEFGQYVTDVRTRNERLSVVLRGLLILFFNKYQRLSSRRLPKWLRIKAGRKYPFYQGTGTGTREPTLDLQAGELVEVKSKDEIMATLSPENRNGGMWFDDEMLPYVGQQFRVARKVQQIIHEKNGKMLKLRDCVVLEGPICQGIYHRFCQRAVLPYWREAWLRRVPESGTDAG